MPMWVARNRTPYAVKRTWGRDKDGVHEWIVIVKGTFDVAPTGKLTLADKQVEPTLMPEFNGEDGASSLRYDADLISPKPGTDVLINATAYAPRGHPTKEFLVSARIDGIQKELNVVGNRRWVQGAFGLSPSAVEPVTEVPIHYERAFGGFDQANGDPQRQRMDARNPVGCGLVPKEGALLPNFEYPNKKIDMAGPAGFTAIASYWSPRLELTGTYDESWRTSRYPLLPADWDARSLLCSPADQRPGHYLRGGELVELTNLTPHGKLRFALPKIGLTFRTRIANRTEEHRSQVSSVIIEPDFPRVIIVWQTSLKVGRHAEYLEETVVREDLYAND